MQLTGKDNYRQFRDWCRTAGLACPTRQGSGRGVSILNGMDDPVTPPFKRAVELIKSVRALSKVDRSFRTSFNMCGWPLPT